MKIEKLLNYKTLRYTNTAASTQERWTRANSVSGHNLLEQTLLNTCATCSTFDGPWNNPFICLRLWEKKIQTYNHGLESKQSLKTELHKPRQMPICRAAIKLRAWTVLQVSIDASCWASCWTLMNSTFHTWILDRFTWF